MGNEIKTKAIVTHALPYHENDMIVTLVSPEYGKLTAVAKGCLKPKAKLRYASEILNFGDYILAERAGKYVITDCSQIEPFIKITYNLESFYAASLIIDALTKVSIQANPQMFVFALESLYKLNSEEDANDTIKEYLLFMLKNSGLDLDFKHCGICGCDLDGDSYYKEADGIVCKDCKGKDGYLIDNISMKYINGKEVPNEMKKKANNLLSDIVYNSLGIKIDKQYFTEKF